MTNKSTVKHTATKREHETISLKDQQKIILKIDKMVKIHERGKPWSLFRIYCIKGTMAEISDAASASACKRSVAYVAQQFVERFKKLTT